MAFSLPSSLLYRRERICDSQKKDNLTRKRRDRIWTRVVLRECVEDRIFNIC